MSTRYQVTVEMDFLVYGDSAEIATERVKKQYPNSRFVKIEIDKDAPEGEIVDVSPVMQRAARADRK